MILKSLKLKNFKCYEDFYQEFQLGITSICGENGAGKSTLLEAISWALFNFLPYASNSRIIRNGAKNAEVELLIQSSLDGHEYIIKRKTQGSSSVYNASQKYMVAEGVSNLQDWVRHELGLRPSDNLTSLCRNGIATPQGSLTIDFTETPEARRRIFDVMLGLDEYKTVQLALTECMKLVGEKLNDVKIDLAASQLVNEEIERLTASLHEKQKEKNKILQEISTLKNSIEATNQALMQAKVARDEKEKSLKDLQNVSEQKTELERDLLELQKATQARDALNGEAQEYTALKDDRKRLQADKIEFDLQNNLQIQLSEALKLEQINSDRLKEQLHQFAQLKKEYDEVQDLPAKYDSLLKGEKALNHEKSALEAELAQKDKLEEERLDNQNNANALQTQIELIESRQAEVAQVAGLEETLERLRLEYHEVLKLEKEINNLKASTEEAFAGLPETLSEVVPKIFDGDILSVEIKQLDRLTELIESREAQILELDKQGHHLAAQRELNRDLIPKLAEGGVCPILLEPCLNLKARDGAFEAQSFLQDQQVELQLRVEALKDQAQDLLTETLALKRLNELLVQNYKLKEQLGPRNSKSLIERGQQLKVEVERIKEYKVSLQALPGLKASLQKLQLKETDLKARLDRMAEQDGRLQFLAGNLNDLSRQITDMKPKAEKALILRSELEKEKLLTQMQQETEAKITGLSKRLHEVEIKLQNWADLPDRLKLLEARLEHLEPVFVRWSQLNDQLNRLPDLLDQLSKLESKRQTLQMKLDSLEPLQKDDKWLVEQSELLAKQQDSLNQQEGLNHSIDYLLKEWKSCLLELTQKQEKFRQQAEKMMGLKRQEQKLTRMRGLFKELAIQMAKQYTSKIGNRATLLFREIMQDASFELIWSEDYEIVMYKNGQKLPFEMLSGGQQTAAAIALRLSLLQELSNIRFAFFDEPTAHLDTERRNQLALQISGIKSFNQLFVITHDESFASQANNVIQIGSS